MSGSISEVRVWPIKNPKPGMKLKANGMFVYDGVFRMKCTLFEGPKGLFVTFPGNYSDKTDEKTGKKIFYPNIKCLDEGVLTQLKAAVLSEYNKVTESNQMNQGEAAGPSNQTETLPSTKRTIPF